jgi:hypothetical protein
MWYKPYGKTGKNVSVIAFGGMRFADPKNIDAAAEVVRYAHGKGINYFDTAPYYCEDKSEEICGAAFKHMKRDSFYVSTKCGEADGAKVRESLERSLKRLGVETIDFFHIWCLVSLDAWSKRKSGGAVAAAMKAKEEGLIKHVAVSSHLPGAELRQVLEEGYFDGVTLGYCAINFPYRQEAVDAAGKLNLGVVTMNPLGGGIIPQHAKRLDFLRAPGDPSVVSAAIRFNISQPAITAALVGFTTTAHVDEACRAAENFTPYGPDHVEAMKLKLRQSFDGLCTGCGYCLPCPHGLAIPKMMDSYNQKILGTQGETEISNRLNWHWGVKPSEAKACALCGACETKCTQRLPIMERMKEIAALQDPK